MRNKYYYLLIVPLFCLLFSSTVNAATNLVNASTTVNSGNNLSITVESYTNLPGEIVEVQDINNTYQSWYKYNPSFNILLSYTNQQWLNGFLIFYFNVTPSGGQTKYSSYIYTPPEHEDGIHIAMSKRSDSQYLFYVYFDNYYNRTGGTNLGNLVIEYIDESTAYSASAEQNFTTSLTISQSSIFKTTVVENDRLSAILYSAITQASGQQLANIISGLQAIQNQDYVYYAQLVSGINQLHTDNNQLHGDLTSILNEVDLDFAAVQTVLDLFPSYRTQVLQYWQDLLAMNAAQSSEAADVESQYADKEAQSATLAAGLGQLVLPSVSSNDFNVLNQVDGTQKANFFGLLSIITNNGFITTLLIIVVTGAIVGYILYGKK